MNPIRVFIVDDNPVWIRLILNAVYDVEDNPASVVGICMNSKYAAAMIKDLRPDVTVLDISLSMAEENKDGLLIADEIRFYTKIVILTELETDFELIGEAFEKGAISFLNKSDLHKLNKTIQEIFSGVYADRKLGLSARAELRMKRRTRRTRDFTKTELIVYELLENGSADHEVAGRLGIEIRTVRNYISKILRKAEARNIESLIKTIKIDPEGY